MMAFASAIADRNFFLKRRALMQNRACEQAKGAE
jgi:hypothetical protein